jgi:ABC-type sugar transport system permease subunit
VTRPAASERRLAWLLLAPTLAVLAAVALLPLLATAWESLHVHDLRMPWLGRPFAGLGNYVEAVRDPRLRDAVLHTSLFTAVTVPFEIALGLALALAIDTLTRGRALARVVVLMPWALPTVVAALVWRFMFETDTGVISRLPFLPHAWLSKPFLAWVPLALGDAWKSTPFVALLLLAGLQGIDPALHEAARTEGAGWWRRFVFITLPLLRPALLVALVFRTLDAFRVFDLVFVLTGGGPGSATEVVSLYAFNALLQDLRFGYGSALSMITFAITLVFALLYIRALQPAEAEA